MRVGGSDRLVISQVAIEQASKFGLLLLDRALLSISSSLGSLWKLSPDGNGGNAKLVFSVTSGFVTRAINSASCKVPSAIPTGLIPSDGR